MIRMIQNILCFLWLIFSVQASLAQTTVDIPLIFDEDDHPVISKPVTPVKKDISTPQKQSASKPIKLSNTTPNIGSNAEPLTQIGIVPPPLPPVTIDLSDSKTQIQPTHPKEPVNTRIQAINLQPVSDNVTWIPPSGTAIGTDVRGFELNDFYLGMTADDVMQIVHEQNYKIMSSQKSISKFRTAYYENLCRNRGIYMPEKIRKCIRSLSQQNGTTYLSKLKVAYPKINETIEFEFTSPATNNRVWKIHYQNKGDNSLTFTQANVQKKRQRQSDFLNAVYDKFGYPDNSEKLIWGSENDAFMQVGIYGSSYDAHITLTDVELSDDDYFEAKDWLDENKPFEHFGFED